MNANDKLYVSERVTEKKVSVLCDVDVRDELSNPNLNRSDIYKMCVP